MFYHRPATANLIRLGAKLPILLNCHRGKPGPFAKCDSEQNQATSLKELPRTHAHKNFCFCKILHKFKRNTDTLTYWHTHYTRVINIKNLWFEEKNVFNYGWTCSSLQNLLLGRSLDLGSGAFGKGNHRCGFCLQLCEMLHEKEERRRQICFKSLRCRCEVGHSGSRRHGCQRSGSAPKSDDTGPLPCVKTRATQNTPARLHILCSTRIL